MISYAEYLAEHIDNSIAYSEYIAEHIDNSIDYSRYLLSKQTGIGGSSGIIGVSGPTGSSGAIGMVGPQGFNGTSTWLNGPQNSFNDGNWMNEYANEHKTNSSETKALPKMLEDFQIIDKKFLNDKTWLQKNSLEDFFPTLQYHSLYE